MYNLLVSYDEEVWEGKPFIEDVGRCIHEYTDTEISEKFGALSDLNIQEVKRFPCVFAYEAGRGKDPKFGLIRDIIKRQNKVRVEYEIIELDKFLTFSDLEDMKFELDISDWELNRTHWAIKNVNLSKELAAKNIILPQWTRREGKSVDITKHIFDVALSFPGEIRTIIEPIVTELEKEIGPNAYFYDKNYTAQLARPSLDLLLQDIYKNRSKLIVVFLCEKYQEKQWCGVEFRAIRETLFESSKNEKVMFIKVDEGKVEGVFKTDGFIDAREHNTIEIASFIKERIELLDKT